MRYHDAVYGDYEITSPVALDLIAAPGFMRLQKIGQFGVPDRYHAYQGYSRLDHSVGVMILLDCLGASAQEQLAGLLHDVSHTAFSHVIDWVLGEPDTESYQDTQHRSAMDRLGLAAILRKHGYAPDQLSDYTRFTLLEQPAPNLCADRIDYALREFSKADIATCLDHLTTRAGTIVFRDQDSAKCFACNFLTCQTQHWGGFESVSRYRHFANALRVALDAGIVTMEDFWQDDEFVLGKLEHAGHPQINVILSYLHHPTLPTMPVSDQAEHKKFRYVDPLIISGDKLVRLSDVDADFQRQVEKARRINAEGVRISVLTTAEN
ncbi:MAG: HD domain-containing protein [Candidatus Kerfeldbacteria bacterium]|nr:HD domain-containing protein [Candidatus Kerfeldbacteria bacterium]